MRTVNKVILLGNVCHDPELKATANGQSLCTFQLATNRVWKNPAGEKQSMAEFHNVVCWSALAEFCAQSVRKSKPLYVEGYLKTHSWEIEGQKHFKAEIVAENVVFLSPKEEPDLPV